jgi:hypothetical protein
MDKFETSKEAEMDADTVESNQLKPSSYSLWPSIFATFLFLAGLLIYSNYSDLFLYLLFIFFPIAGIFSVANLLFFRLKKSISYGIPVMLMSIAFFSDLRIPIAEGIVNTRHRIQFFFGKSNYESEVQKLKESGVFYKEWLWGSQGGTQYYLIYDESDKSAVLKPEEPPCSETILKLKIHFYVRRNFCP